MRRSAVIRWAAMVVVASQLLGLGPSTQAEQPVPQFSSTLELTAAHALAARSDALRQDPDAFHRSVQLTLEATAWQARFLGLPWDEAMPPVSWLAPSDALMILAGRLDVPLTDSQARALTKLDQLPAPARDALGAFLAAFLAFDGASRANAAAWSASMSLTDGTAGRFEHGALESVGVLEARNAMLATVPALRNALAALPPEQRVAPFAVPPVIALDLMGVDNVWADDVILSIDVGGSDSYLNNAGGNGIGRCAIRVLSLEVGLPYPGAAAALDFGGNDVYNDGRSCGVNGGGAVGGSGFLLDAGDGNDRYVGGTGGTNGGGDAGGHGLLLDDGGADYYQAAPGQGVGGGNGGGNFYGTGFLLDGGGVDVYSAGDFGTNGGGSEGSGFLLDVAGNDTYLGGDGATNGGGYVRGAGTLVDLAGNDRYSGGYASNGGGVVDALCFIQIVCIGTGFLYDRAGTDRYDDALVHCDDCTVVPKGLVGAQVDDDA